MHQEPWTTAISRGPLRNLNCAGSDGMSDNPAEAVLAGWLSQLEARLAARDWSGASTLFEPAGYWRDLVAFTWSIVTVQGQGPITTMLASCGERTAATAWQVEPGAATTSEGIAEGFITFETSTGRGRGHLRIKDGRARTVLTTLQAIKGHEEKRGPNRERGTTHGAIRGRIAWGEARAEERAALGRTQQPFCLIIGGGQGGIALGARLKRLGVPALVVDRLAKPGDTWRSRYQSLCLHDPVWYDHLPYLPFPDHWPVFIPKDRMGDWLEAYVQIMDIDYWGSTTVTSARPDPQSGNWTVTLERAGETLTLHPQHVVLATGMSGFPNVPHFPGQESFKGTQTHSSAHHASKPYEGKRCVIIGANNSAHDIAADLWEHGASVTMVQRSSTLVVRSATLMEKSWGRLFSEEALAKGITTDKADLLHASVPYAMLPAIQKPIYEEIAERDRDLYNRLRAVGFMLDFGEDGTGLGLKYLRRGSGYYIDVGACDLVASGEIALKSGVDVTHITPDGVSLSDGSHLPCELIVYATGYGPMNQWIGALMGEDIEARVGKVWGLGSNTTHDPGPWEGELRNMWKPTAQDGLWLHGGNLQQSRHYSLYLALQLKARQLSLPVAVYQPPGGSA
jgi:putative flavoprotein involved in K+ transport